MTSCPSRARAWRSSVVVKNGLRKSESRRLSGVPTSRMIFKTVSDSSLGPVVGVSWTHFRPPHKVGEEGARHKASHDLWSRRRVQPGRESARPQPVGLLVGGRRRAATLRPRHDGGRPARPDLAPDPARMRQGPDGRGRRQGVDHAHPGRPALARLPVSKCVLSRSCH